MTPLYAQYICVVFFYSQYSQYGRIADGCVENKNTFIQSCLFTILRLWINKYLQIDFCYVYQHRCILIRLFFILYHIG